MVRQNRKLSLDPDQQSFQHFADLGLTCHHTRPASRDGFVLSGHATAANRSDAEEFVAVLDEIDVKPGRALFADKGYSSQLNRDVFQVRGLVDGIMLNIAALKAAC